MQGVMSAPRSAKARSRRRWLALALRVLWIGVLVLAVESLLVSFGPGYTRMTTVCTGAACVPSQQLTQAGVDALADYGWSVAGFALFHLCLVLITAFIYGAVAIVIFRAHPHDPFALFVSLTLLLFGTFMSEHITVIATVHPALDYVATFVPVVALICLAVLFYLFPDGRFVPGWTRWAAVGWVALPVGVFVSAFFWEYSATLELVIAVALILLALTCLVAPIYRYVKVANRIQRQQTKWVMFGFLQVLFLLVLLEIMPRFLPDLDVAGTLLHTLSNLVQVVSLVIMPVTIGLALLRYRLWDVDLVINRSLVYVPLTSILAVIYTTSLTVSQKIFTTVSGEQSPAVIISTTIILTATFSPIRNWLQGVVDHYFKEPPDPLKPLKEMERQVAEVAQILDRPSMARRLVRHATAAYRTNDGALYWQQGAQMQLLYATPGWQDEQAAVTLPLVWEEQPLGRLLLGEKTDGDDYEGDECAALQRTVTSIVQSLRVVAAARRDA